MFPPSGEGRRTPTMWSALSKGSHREEFSFPHPRMETDTVSETLYFVVFKIVDNGQTPEIQ
jgi:hypothetical protein